MAGGPLLILSLALLGLEAQGQGSTQGKKQVSGGATVYLGQDRDIWRPLIYTTANLREISNIKSSFEFRTFDAEGLIFYGDSKNGREWFVLSLKDGIPLMQISRGEALVSAAGGPKLDDGKWHTLEVSSEGNFVILEVDGSKGLVVGIQSNNKEEVISGELRLALGGLLIDEKMMPVQFVPQMDGCVRGGSWLNLSIPWVMDVEQLWSCHENIQPGSHFPGTGLAIFNTSVFTIEDENGVTIELWGDFIQMDGTIVSIMAPGQETFSLIANNSTKEVTLTFNGNEIGMKGTFKRLAMTFRKDSFQAVQGGDETVRQSFSLPSQPGYLAAWKEGRMAFGGLLGDRADTTGSQFLKGCLEKIQVQGQDLDLDLASRHMSISSHSCPV